MFTPNHSHFAAVKEELIIMKAIICAVIALACVVGLAMANYGGYSYMPLYGSGYGSRGGSGFGNGGFLMLIGLIFLILVLFGGFNNTSSTGSSVSFVNLTG